MFNGDELLWTFRVHVHAHQQRQLGNLTQCIPVQAYTTVYMCTYITHTYSWIVIRSIEDQLIRLCVCGHGDNDSWRHMSHIAYMSHGGCVAGSQGPSSWDNGNSLIAAK